MNFVKNQRTNKAALERKQARKMIKKGRRSEDLSTVIAILRLAAARSRSAARLIRAAAIRGLNRGHLESAKSEDHNG